MELDKVSFEAIRKNFCSGLSESPGSHDALYPGDCLQRLACRDLVLMDLDQLLPPGADPPPVAQKVMRSSQRDRM
jgi:hypothetical protein